MIVLFLILFVSLAGVAVALFLPGYGDLILIAAPSAIAALFLWIRAAVRGRKSAENWVLIDGSNVMYWKDNTPKIETLREVIAYLRGLKHTPAVVFDANAGYLLAGKYQHDYAMANHLGLTEECVMVVPKGTVADTFLLTAARDFNAPIVTDDRYRDWKDDFPEIAQPGRLIRGGYRNGVLWFEEIDQSAPA
ncbi:Zc3h12a-like Ribonuclease NYN domain-containing protein [Roseovarius marisflavi]|uniref:Zc3h12a-like Ribonuclease NYN domain-containing protein n=1 Tax=Roseovarius marisflavi TaxID=1054996 RepID=A0A1M6XVX2_9RHOB|nr:hypothetical protein [Roseovarius marisflavi]SHL10131.1 Zc3h12a-like Ribonuclease NYN domain-containing protein [Roseovarius marisflavi]